MKKIFIIFISILLIPLSTHALSFEPGDGKTYEVGNNLQLLYDYTYYTYCKPYNCGLLSCTPQYNDGVYDCKFSSAGIFNSSSYDSKGIDYIYTNGTNLVFVPNGYTSGSTVVRGMYATYTINPDSNEFELTTAPTGSWSSFSTFSPITHPNKERILSSDKAMYTTIDKADSFDYTSVSGRIRTFEDINKTYISSDSGGGSGGSVSVDIDYTIFYIIAVLILVFLFVYYLRLCFPMRGGKDL